ncbi:MAG: glycosyl transferase [Candidatus Cloacimonadota bacterium]|nr:MAG: glycosyl transferase [Candidatus Cloacimonadota bacterium]
MYSVKKNPKIDFLNEAKLGLVSVIIPTFNRSRLLQLAINSVLNQSYKQIELIIINDGSTDDTKQVLNSYKNQLKIIHQENQGVSKARNAGLEVSSGEWIAFLDSDDTWLERKIEEQIKKLKDSDLFINHTQEIWIRNGVKVNPKQKHFKFDGSNFEDNLDICRISPSSVIIHRQVFEKLGGFDINLPACEDYDLWLRVSNLFEVQYLDKQFVCKTGGHEDQLSRKYFGMDRFRIVALAKMILNEDLTDDRKLNILNEIKKKLKVYLKGCQKRNKTKEIEFFKDLLEKCEKKLKV